MDDPEDGSGVLGLLEVASGWAGLEERSQRVIKEESGREDLNLRPPAPKAGALPGCATPRVGRQ
jgi:hypothetical protein